jgi:tetratricopeptide (TPR) repeat protein
MSKPESPESTPESHSTPSASAAVEPGEDTVEETGTKPEPEPWTEERVTEWNAYYDVYVVLGVLLLAFVASANKISHSAIWTQLKAGEIMADTGKPLLTDVFSYTETDQRWVNVPWLFEWGHALAYKGAYGLIGTDANDPAGSARRAEQVASGALVAINALVRVLAVLVLLGIRWPGPGLWWSAVCVAVAVGATISPFGLTLGGVAGPAIVAPGTWGQLLLAIELLLLYRAIDRGSRTAIYGLIPLFLLWANLDESFLAGLLVLAAVVVGRLFRGREFGAKGISFAKGVAILVACAGVCLVNPSFYRAYPAALSPIVHLFQPSGGVLTDDQLSFFGSGILQGDKERAAELANQLKIYYFAFVGLGLASFVVNYRRFSLSRFLPFAVMAVLWAALLRFGVEFAVVLAAVVALNGQEWYQDRLGVKGRLGLNWSLWSTGGRFVTLLFLFVCVAKGLTGFGRELGEPQFGFGFNPDDFAFEAADYLRSAPLQGRVLNTALVQGDSLVWRAYPVRQTFMDGRSQVFPLSLQQESQRLRKALSENDVARWKPVLDRYGITTVMIQPSKAPITYGRLMDSPEWIPFYDDGGVVMFGRSDAPATDLAYFQENRLDPEILAYVRAKPVPVAVAPTPVTQLDAIFQNRFLEGSQPHTDASQRWLAFDPKVAALPSPARCFLAIREARTALARKPDDTYAYRSLAQAYGALVLQETAIVAGIKLTPEDRERVQQIIPNPALLMDRFRQEITSLNFAIQTSPPPRNEQAIKGLFDLNNQLGRLYLSMNYKDLARDRFRAAADLSPSISHMTADERAALSRLVRQLDDEVRQVEEGINDLVTRRQPGPVMRADYAMSGGAPGLAIHELEEALQINDRPDEVKPKLVDLYCDTGQPEKALELIAPGNTDSPGWAWSPRRNWFANELAAAGTEGGQNLGREPGIAALRQARVYFLLGNYDYATSLWEKTAIPQLRDDRAYKAVQTARLLIKGDIKGTSNTVEVLPGQISTQAVWQNELAMCQLEGGQPSAAAENFAEALKLSPTLRLRAVAEYYLEKLGKLGSKTEDKGRPTETPALKSEGKRTSGETPGAPIAKDPEKAKP